MQLLLLLLFLPSCRFFLTSCFFLSLLLPTFSFSFLFLASSFLGSSFLGSRCLLWRFWKSIWTVSEDGSVSIASIVSWICFSIKWNRRSNIQERKNTFREEKNEEKKSENKINIRTLLLLHSAFFFLPFLLPDSFFLSFFLLNRFFSFFPSSDFLFSFSYLIWRD